MCKIEHCFSAFMKIKMPTKVGEINWYRNKSLKNPQRCRVSPHFPTGFPFRNLWQCFWSCFPVRNMFIHFTQIRFTGIKSVCTNRKVNVCWFALKITIQRQCASLLKVHLDCKNGSWTRRQLEFESQSGPWPEVHKWTRSFYNGSVLPYTET